MPRETTVRRSSGTTFTLCLIYLSWLYSTDLSSREAFAKLIRLHDRERRFAGIPSIAG